MLHDWGYYNTPDRTHEDIFDSILNGQGGPRQDGGLLSLMEIPSACDSLRDHISRSHSHLVVPHSEKASEKDFRILGIYKMVARPAGPDKSPGNFTGGASEDTAGSWQATLTFSDKSQIGEEKDNKSIPGLSQQPPKLSCIIGCEQGFETVDICDSEDDSMSVGGSEKLGGPWAALKDNRESNGSSKETGRDSTMSGI